MIRRIAPFAAVAIVASLLIVVPALGSSHEDAVRLHLGSDGRSFSYDGVTQTLTVPKNGCQINSSEPLIDLSSSGTTSPGINSLSLGVKSSGSNSNGTPCGQTDSTETLSLAAQQAGTSPKLAGRSFNKVRLDVEMTGNAVVQVRFFVGSSTTPAKTAILQTGTSITSDQSNDPLYDTSAPYELTTADYVSDTNGEADGDLTDACAAPNSSGPNNAGNDNCLWTIDPGVVFDRVSITTTIGAVSLEGSGDFGNDTDHDSLFFLANATPTADSDSYSTDEDTTLNVSAANGVLVGDADADGDTLTAVLGTDVSNGTLTLNADGSFTYVPYENWNGTDSFTYTASDGSASSGAATVTITVNDVNDAPVGVVGNASTDEDASTTITVATDVDSTTLDAECSTSQGGTYLDNGDGTVTYTPPSDFNGTDILTCTVTDDEGGTTSTSAEITVTVGAVNDGPVANDDDAYVNAGASVNIDVLGNDTDVDGDALTITDVTQGASGSVSTDGASVTYAASASFTGSDTFTYTVSDGNATDTGTVTVYELFECGETLTVTEGDTSAAYQRLPEQEGCGEGKPYFVDIITTTQGTTQLPTIVFQPRPLTGDPVEDCSVTPSLCLDEFAATISFGPRAEANAPDTGTLHYDPVNREPADYETEGVFRDMQWCEIPDFDPYASGRPASGAILPSGESWCIASVSTSSASETETLTTWVLYGIGDPAKRI